MQYKNLGRSGLKVSQLSYGAWVSFGNQLDVKDAKSLLQCCRDHGVNFFDNAEVYANGRAEEIMGQAIRELGWKRSDIVVSTKIFWGGPGPNDKGLSRKHIVEGTKASLKRLDMDYVDLIYCHRPDVSTPIEETVRAMNYVIDHGWAFYWGTSEWSAQQITEAWGVANRLDLVGPIVEQPEYNLLNRHKVESEFLPLYSNYGIGLTTWSPLASGVLTGKYSKGVPPDSRFALENYKNLASRSLVDDVLKKVNGLKPIADELDVPLSQLAIAWCASNPNVSSVITGATKESQSLRVAKGTVPGFRLGHTKSRVELFTRSKQSRYAADLGDIQEVHGGGINMSTVLPGTLQLLWGMIFGDYHEAVNPALSKGTQEVSADPTVPSPANDNLELGLHSTNLARIFGPRLKRGYTREGAALEVFWEQTLGKY
ncbi:hypothetical protein GIB67_006579 [Kingdonia uniflora]|uniref:Probable voltage-gated potassium channel subunit beta n=1 Tax=Kingdonia uniflora TaxID=39325 RepID=A0A7J7LF48_9MAGN|nr:hypothetical protein GIB67_006579 [Kingdonia uniflora]